MEISCFPLYSSIQGEKLKTIKSNKLEGMDVERRRKVAATIIKVDLKPRDTTQFLINLNKISVEWANQKGVYNKQTNETHHHYHTVLVIVLGIIRSKVFRFHSPIPFHSCLSWCHSMLIFQIIEQWFRLPSFLSFFVFFFLVLRTLLSINIPPIKFSYKIIMYTK